MVVCGSHPPLTPTEDSNLLSPSQVGAGLVSKLSEHPRTPQPFRLPIHSVALKIGP